MNDKKDKKKDKKYKCKGCGKKNIIDRYWNYCHKCRCEG